MAHGNHRSTLPDEQEQRLAEYQDEEAYHVVDVAVPEELAVAVVLLAETLLKGGHAQAEPARLHSAHQLGCRRTDAFLE